MRHDARSGGLIVRLYTLVLRTVAKNMTSHEGKFTWPTSGPVSCPDWDPTPGCGGGLHGLAWGEGSSMALPTIGNRRWLVVEVPTSAIVRFDGKCKFPSGDVVHCGDQKSATDYLLNHAPAGTVCHYATVTAGDGGTATAGAYGTATAGDHGKATAGYYGMAIAGDSGTATADTNGTATAGVYGTATARHDGTATAGGSGKATAGYRGTATAGDGGTATAGVYGQLRIAYWDHNRDRERTAIAYVGENGIKANTPYQLDDDHRFVEATNNRGGN